MCLISQAQVITACQPCEGCGWDGKGLHSRLWLTLMCDLPPPTRAAPGSASHLEHSATLPDLYQPGSLKTTQNSTVFLGFLQWSQISSPVSKPLRLLLCPLSLQMCPQIVCSLLMHVPLISQLNYNQCKFRSYLNMSSKPQTHRGVQPTACGLHVAQGSSEWGPTQNRKCT